MSYNENTVRSMHEFLGSGRGGRRFNSFLGVVNAQPRYHSFIGVSRPQQAHGTGGASAPSVPTPYVFHNDQSQREATQMRDEGVLKQDPTTRRF